MKDWPVSLGVFGVVYLIAASWWLPISEIS